MSEIRESLKPVFIRDETDPDNPMAGHVEIHDDAGVFAGYDPTPVQVLDVCKRLGMSDPESRLAYYATVAFHNDLIDETYWGAKVEASEIRKLVGERFRDMVARNYLSRYWAMKETRNFTPGAAEDDFTNMEEKRNG